MLELYSEMLNVERKFFFKSVKNRCGRFMQDRLSLYSVGIVKFRIQVPQKMGHSNLRFIAIHKEGIGWYFSLAYISPINRALNPN